MTEPRLLTVREALYVMFGTTPRQADVLLAIVLLRRRLGWPPSRRELAEHFGVQINAIHGHIVALQRKGAVTFERTHGRTLTPRVEFVRAEDL